MEYKELFEYDNIQIENKVRFSPSGFCNYYESPYHWYKSQILNENNFKGNTQTVIGTLTHARIEAKWLGLEIDENVEIDYISRFDENPSVDCWKIADTVADIWNIIVDNLDLIGDADEVEQRVVFEIPNSRYFIGGTFDYRRGTTIGDIKTISTTPKQIKFNHKYQIYLYELARRMNKEEPMDCIEVIYIVKTKIPKILVLSEPIDEDFMAYVKDEIKKMVKRLDICEKSQEMVELMFPSNPNTYL